MVATTIPQVDAPPETTASPPATTGRSVSGPGRGSGSAGTVDGGRIRHVTIQRSPTDGAERPAQAPGAQPTPRPSKARLACALALLIGLMVATEPPQAATTPEDDGRAVGAAATVATPGEDGAGADPAWRHERPGCRSWPYGGRLDCVLVGP